MDKDAKAEKMFRLGMMIQGIAMSVDDETLARIKPKLERLEAELVELFEQIKEVQ